MARQTKKPPEQKREPGRPTRYRPEYAEQAYKICLLGATHEDLARFFEVSVATIKNWMRDHGEFLAAIKNGKEIADSTVAESLYKRAKGYVAPDTHFAVINGEVVPTPTEKHHPPDTTACIFWLKNRQPKFWRDKTEIDQKSEIKFIDESQLDSFYERIMQASAEKSKNVADRKAEDLKQHEEQ